MKLIIAEKESVGTAIANAIAANTKEKGYYSGNGYLVSWLAGHLVQLCFPSSYEEKYKKWNMSDLPILPNKFKYEIVPGKEYFYKNISYLMNRNDVESLICATDAGREGELIFRLVYEHTGCKKPFERLWISSMEENAIINGMAELKSSSSYDNLYQSALCRMQADWIVGINESRYYSTAYKTKLNVGRVQTPTLNLIVKRKSEIENFIPVPYYTVTADLGGFTAKATEDTLDKANALVRDCAAGRAYVTNVRTEHITNSSPLLFSLSTLQAEANDYYGYTLQQTLNIAQSLYEKKITTYPRTDSNFITGDMSNTAKQVLDRILENTCFPFVNEIVKNYKNYNISQLINNDKVTDHHAIIPTLECFETDIDTLSKDEKNILLLIVGRYLTAAAASMKYKRHDIVLEINGHLFGTESNAILENGYKEILNEVDKHLKTKNSVKAICENRPVPPMSEGNEFTVLNVSYEKKFKKPPLMYTDATLVKAMKNIHNTMDTGELKQTMKEAGGLGTEATRAALLENLVKNGYIERRKKNIIPTDKGITLIAQVEQELKDPETTARWEQRLEKIENGKENPIIFMSDIEDFINNHIGIAKQYHDSELTADIFLKSEKISLGKCPRCSNPVYESKKNYYCASGKDCGFKLWKEDKFFLSKGKKLGNRNVKDILGSGKTIIKGCKSSKGSTYDIVVQVKDDGKYIKYQMEFCNTLKKTKPNI